MFDWLKELFLPYDGLEESTDATGIPVSRGMFVSFKEQSIKHFGPVLRIDQRGNNIIYTVKCSDRITREVYRENIFKI